MIRVKDLKVVACAASFLTGTLVVALSEVRVEQSASGKLLYRFERKSILTPKSKKDLSSGLNTQVLIHSKLQDRDGHQVAEDMRKISIRYDLWEEKFWMEALPGQAKKSFATLTEVESWVEAPGPFMWMPVADLKSGASYQLVLLATLNPVDQDRLAEVQKWMIQQRITGRIGGPERVGGEVALSGETPFSALFYSLWKRAASGELAGEVQRKAISEFFDPKLIPKTSLEGGVP